MQTYQDYVTHLSKIADVSNSIALLNWDQEVMMPPKGAEKRAQQIATLSGILHELSTENAFGKSSKKTRN
jgi:carboxypeptidase Taq